MREKVIDDGVIRRAAFFGKSDYDDVQAVVARASERGNNPVDSLQGWIETMCPPDAHERIWFGNGEPSKEKKASKKAEPPAAPAPAPTTRAMVEKRPDSAVPTIEEKADASLVKSEGERFVEYATIEEFESVIIVGVSITVQTIVQNAYLVSIDRSGKRKARSQPSVWGQRVGRDGKNYWPTQHLVPILVEIMNDDGAVSREEKWFDTNAGFRKAWKEQVALGGMPEWFKLRTTGVDDDYKVAIIPVQKKVSA